MVFNGNLDSVEIRLRRTDQSDYLNDFADEKRETLDILYRTIFYIRTSTTSMSN